MRPFGRQGALCAPGRGLPRGSVKGPAGHVARDCWSLRPPGKQFRRWAAPVRQRRAACAWPNLSAENLSPRVVRPVGRGAHPSEDTVAMAEAAPARVSAPAGGRRVRGSRHSRPRAPPPYPAPSPPARGGHGDTGPVDTEATGLHPAAGGPNTRPGGLRPKTGDRDLAPRNPARRSDASRRPRRTLQMTQLRAPARCLF